MILIRKAQFWSMDAIIAVVVFMVAFILVLGIIVELGEDDTRVDLQMQGMIIQTALAADRPISFLDGVTVDPGRLALFTSRPYDDLREEFGIDGDFCIYFEDEEGRPLSIPSTRGPISGVGHSGVSIGGEECETEFGVCEDLDGDGYGDGPDCVDADPDDSDPESTPETAEDWCNGIDDDGNGAIDDGDYSAITGSSCGVDEGVCSSGTYSSCRGASGFSCDGAVWPTAELCDDGLDNDCDGDIDEDCVVCPDNDLDGHKASFCGGDDCNDAQSTIHPGAGEICDDGVDNDCDGMTDEGCTPACPDADRDGHQDRTCGGDDCNDADPGMHPGATEICDDGIDNDCDNDVDLLDTECMVCTDADGDGHFIPDSNPACGPNDDCDDTDPATYPGAPEPDCPAKDFNCDTVTTCTVPPSCTADEVGMCSNGIDDDCDGSMDCMDSDCSADPVCGPSCTDADGDGYAVEGGACGPIDCDDTNNGIFPGRLERCGDGIDQDCDGSDLVADNDGDGDYDKNLCQNGYDCDDNEARVNSAEHIAGDDPPNYCDAAGNPWCTGDRCVLCSPQLDDDCDYRSTDPSCGSPPGMCETLYCANPPYCR